jgi:hypothetical protein
VSAGTLTAEGGSSRHRVPHPAGRRRAMRATSCRASRFVFGGLWKGFTWGHDWSAEMAVPRRRCGDRRCVHAHPGGLPSAPGAAHDGGARGYGYGGGDIDWAAACARPGRSCWRAPRCA